MSTLVQEIEGIDVESPEQLGELMQRDVNGEYHEKPGAFQLVVSTTDKRRRSGVRNHIVETVNANKPLTISTHSLATRVLFKEGDGGVPQAYGVEFMEGEGLYGADKRYDPAQSGIMRNVTATREVVVAGGAFNTPQILKLSGVGPREELESFGIPLIADLPAVVSELASSKGHICLDYFADSPKKG
jgi:choline dehydrogenase